MAINVHTKRHEQTEVDSALKWSGVEWRGEKRREKMRMGFCSLKVAVVVLAEGLQEDGDDGHDWLHHAELKGGLNDNSEKGGGG